MSVFVQLPENLRVNDYVTIGFQDARSLTGDDYWTGLVLQASKTSVRIASNAGGAFFKAGQIIWIERHEEAAGSEGSREWVADDDHGSLKYFVRREDFSEVAVTPTGRLSRFSHAFDAHRHANKLNRQEES